MSIYCDLCVEPASVEEAREMARLLRRMGVRRVAVESRGDPERARGLAEAMRGEGLEAATRVTVEAADWGSAAKQVKRLAELFDIVAVRPRSAEAARMAARDARIRVVQLPPGMARYMDRSQAAMLREGGGVVEVRLRPLLHPGDPRQALRGVMVVARRAAAYEAPLAASSCARSRWELWPPGTVVGLLSSFGLPPGLARLSVSGFCSAIIRGASRK